MFGLSRGGKGNITGLKKDVFWVRRVFFGPPPTPHDGFPFGFPLQHTKRGCPQKVGRFWPLILQSFVKEVMAHGRAV